MKAYNKYFRSRSLADAAAADLEQDGFRTSVSQVLSVNGNHYEWLLEAFTPGVSMKNVWKFHANCLNDDGFGNLVPVPGAAWSAAHYHVHGALYNGSIE